MQIYTKDNSKPEVMPLYPDGVDVGVWQDFGQSGLLARRYCLTVSTDLMDIGSGAVWVQTINHQIQYRYKSVIDGSLTFSDWLDVHFHVDILGVEPK